MAFLCPVRIRRNKKKKSVTPSGYASEGDEKVTRTPGMGRITGSASIETLVRVGLEKEAGLSPDSKMVVLQDFTPCVDDELEVKRGSVVNVLYQENDWVYVISEGGGNEGFIPHSYCAPASQRTTVIATHKAKKMPREAALEAVDADHNTTLGTGSGGQARRSDSLYDFDNPALVNSDNDSYGCGSGGTRGAAVSPSRGATELQSQPPTPDIHPFFKDPAGHYIVLYTFIARDENDVSVERGEFVTVLNREDPDWYWILRSDGQEGFVPSGFVYPADVIQDHIQQGSSSNNAGGGEASNVSELSPSVMMGGLSSGAIHPSSYAHSTPHNINSTSNDDLRFHGSELVMLYDYKAQAPDDLSVRRGDWIYADLSNQTVDGWLWAFAPKPRKCGFIPKAYARPPAMTSL